MPALDRICRGLGRRARIVLTAVSCVAAPAAAHDLWIEPASFQPRAGEPLVVEVHVGERFRGRAVAPDPRRILRFVAISDAGEGALDAARELGPGTFAASAGNGATWLVYESRPHTIELSGERFDSYLEEEGLERIRELRRARGAGGAPGRERFSRSAKALVGTGATGPEASDRALGLELELVLERPTRAAGGDSPVTVRLLRRGAPLADARISAFARDDRHPARTARTDAEGRARLELAGGTVWLLRALHLEPTPAGSASDADWESHWASLIFELPRRGEGSSR